LAIDVYKEWLGIPEGPRPPDHYALLRVKQFDDEFDRIRSNYRKLNSIVRKYATGQYLEESQALLNELAKAMLCLTDAERKREYDESQGREFPEDETGPKTIDQVLISQKHITREQAQQAIEYADQAGLGVRDALVQLKMVEPDIATQALAQELGLSYVDLNEMIPDDEVLDRLPRKVARQYSVLPLFLDDGTLLVAGVHQIDHAVEDELRLRYDGVPVRTVLATKGALDAAIGKYYAPGARSESATQQKLAAGKAAAGKPAAGKTDKADSKTKPEKAGAEKTAQKAVRRGPKTAEQIGRDRQITIIAVCWSVFLAYVLDMYVLTPRVMFDAWTFVLWLGLPGITLAVCWFQLLSKR